MTNGTTRMMTLAEFEQLLEVYGSDRTRWPLNARASAAARLMSDAGARRLLAEASALDAVLAAAPELDPAAMSALADRIAALTRRAPRLVATANPAIVALPTGATPHDAAGTHRELWRGAALLAASLVIGIFVGQSQFGAGALPALEELAGLSSSRLAMADVHLESVDED